MGTKSSGDGTYFDLGARLGRKPLVKPRDPVAVRKNLRQGALGAFFLAGGLPAASAWTIGVGSGESWSPLSILFAIVALVGLVLGAYFMLEGWLELPPRTLRSKAPGLVALAQVAIVALAALVHEFWGEFELPWPVAIGFVHGGLALQFLLAGWSVWALPWRWRGLIAMAFMLGAIAFIPLALHASGWVALPSVLVLVAAISAPALLSPALVAFGLGTRRAARLATDAQLV